MNNIEELSKPVAEVNSKYGDPEAFGERELNVLADIQKMPYQTKFYSQEYVDALIAQLEAAKQEVKELKVKLETPVPLPKAAYFKNSAENIPFFRSFSVIEAIHKAGFGTVTYED